MSAVGVSGPGVRRDGAMSAAPLADDGEFAAFRAALEAARLPAADLRDPNLEPFRFAAGGKTIGFGAVERYGRDVLMRSIVVAADARGDGAGRTIVDCLLAFAARGGAERAFLFTTDARRYFEGLGFEAIDRGSAPASILATRQASGLCPASAVLMARPVAP